MTSHTVRDLALATLRLVLGGLCVLHGLDYFFGVGMRPTEAAFAAAGMPAAHLMVVVLGAVSIAGGLLLIIGLLSTIAASLLLLTTLWLGWFLHLGTGVGLLNPGLELDLVLAASLLILIVFGGGRFSLDGYLAAGGEDTV